MNIESMKQTQWHKIAHNIFTGPDVEMQLLAPKSEQLVVSGCRMQGYCELTYRVHS